MMSGFVGNRHPSGGVVAREIWVMESDGSNPRPIVRNGAFNESPSWVNTEVIAFASDISGNWEIYTQPLGGGPPTNVTRNPFADQYPRVSPDGSRILFHSNRDYNFEVYSVAADGTDVRNLTQSPHDDRFATWVPDGTGILWSRFIDSFDIWSMAADG